MTTSMNPRARRVLSEILDGTTPYPSMWAALQISLESYEYGHICMQTRADDSHLNAFGGVHGGYSAAALDTALGLAVFVSLPDEEVRHTTVDLAVKIVRPIPTGVDLAVETRLVHLSNSIGVSAGTIASPEGKVLAHGTTTCHIRRPRQPG